MIKQILFLSMLFVYSVSYAQEGFQNDSINNVSVPNQNNIRYLAQKGKKVQSSTFTTKDSLKTSTVTYATDKYVNDWKSNWFLNTSIGIGAFVGNPLGCEDLFGRTQPVFHTSIGKWFNQTIAGRASFQGFKLKNHSLEQQNYYHVHADLLWNMTRELFEGNREMRWNLIPYVGTGMVYNKQSQQHPFTLNYGFINNFKINNQLSLSLELGGFTTFADFDGKGSRNKFGDNLFHLSAGVNITLGEKDWKHNSNRNLSFVQNKPFTTKVDAGYEQRQQAIIGDSLNKEIRYRNMEPQKAEYPLNHYSGLNSLRKRLYTSTDERQNTLWEDSTSKQLTGEETTFGEDKKINKERHLKVPILFFFKIGTTTLTDSSQLANLDEIAEMCKKHNRILKITGYADSATGNEIGNIILSDKRSKYIASELSKRGIPLSSIQQEGKGGIDIYSPMPANRCVCVEIAF